MASYTAYPESTFYNHYLFSTIEHSTTAIHSSLNSLVSHQPPSNVRHNTPPPTIMITDDQLYQLAIFLGSVSMLLIVLYHFLEVNAEDDAKTPLSAERKADTVPGAKPVRS
ncbi:unnamed protein product [Aureobasidium uvarum]|uniref:Dolichyl-diphosphooligosaccharide--protein glycosyltransferase subunit 4 n=1 Tax=Aureobasidium uvarum TaxID=2773716 RepID=A0A9N8KJP3_9PEZI|nr:unnamed protein product [Aureobasidium uvarum]